MTTDPPLTAVEPTSFPVTHPPSPMPDEVGDGAFSRAVDAFYWGVRLTANLSLAAAPMVLLALLLRPTAALAWLVVLAMLTLGPALSAALFAVRARYVDPALPVSRAFWRGYRLGWRDAALLWTPATLVVGITAAVLAGGPEASLPPVYRGVLLGLAALLAVGTLHAIALATFFRFSLPDLVQLGAYYLVRRWRSSLGVLVLVVAAVAIAGLLSDLALALLGGVWVWLWYRGAASMLRDAYARYGGGMTPQAPADHGA